MEGGGAIGEGGSGRRVHTGTWRLDGRNREVARVDVARLMEALGGHRPGDGGVLGVRYGQPPCTEAVGRYRLRLGSGVRRTALQYGPRELGLRERAEGGA